jgi:hypothetical protein
MRITAAGSAWQFPEPVPWHALDRAGHSGDVAAAWICMMKRILKYLLRCRSRISGESVDEEAEALGHSMDAGPARRSRSAPPSVSATARSGPDTDSSGSEGIAAKDGGGLSKIEVQHARLRRTFGRGNLIEPTPLRGGHG